MSTISEEDEKEGGDEGGRRGGEGEKMESPKQQIFRRQFVIYCLWICVMLTRQHKCLRPTQIKNNVGAMLSHSIECDET